MSVPPRRSPAHLVRRLVQRWHSDRAARLEEREWRRRIVLASRKIQHVHTSLSEDLSDVRGLKAHIEHARPEIQRLESALETSREVFDKLQHKLDEHAQTMSSHVDVDALTARSDALEARTRELEGQVAERDATVRELRALVAGLREELGELQARPAPVAMPEAEESRRRIEALERELATLATVREDLQRALSDLEAVRTAADLRVQRVESQLRVVEDERVKEAARQVGEQARLETELERERIARAALEQELAAQGDAPVDPRVAELEAELATVNARAQELEAQARAAFLREQEEEQRARELADASGRFEQQIEELQTLVEGFETSAEQDAAQEAEHAARVLELDGRLQDVEAARTAAEERLAEQAERLRASEIQRLDLEARLQQELNDFADHSRARQRDLEQRLAAKEREAGALASENDLLEQRIANLTRRLEAHEELQREALASSRDLEERSARLLELMGRADGEADVEGIERVEPTGDVYGPDVELPDLPAEAVLEDGVEADPER